MTTPSTSSRKRQANLTPPNNAGKKSKEKANSICPVCDETIMEADEKNDGHEAVFCEGECQIWLHRKCAGLTHQAFAKLSKSDDPYFCVYCTLEIKNKEISALKEQIKVLTSKLNAQSSYQPQPSNQTEMVQSLNHTTNNRGSSASSSSIPVNIDRRKAPPLSLDKKFNVVMYGISECPQNTSRQTRQLTDLENILKVFSDAQIGIDNSSIKDFFRLGKFNSKRDSKRPRPILIKFLRSADASKVLSNRGLFPSPTYIKPDLTVDERAKDLVLLKERWALITQKIDRKRIKIRNKSIYLDDNLYGHLEGTTFHLNSTTHNVSDSAQEDHTTVIDNTHDRRSNVETPPQPDHPSPSE